MPIVRQSNFWTASTVLRRRSVRKPFVRRRSRCLPNIVPRAVRQQIFGLLQRLNRCMNGARLCWIRQLLTSVSWINMMPYTVCNGRSNAWSLSWARTTQTWNLRKHHQRQLSSLCPRMVNGQTLWLGLEDLRCCFPFVAYAYTIIDRDAFQISGPIYEGCDDHSLVQKTLEFILIMTFVPQISHSRTTYV